MLGCQATNRALTYPIVRNASATRCISIRCHGYCVSPQPGMMIVFEARPRSVVFADLSTSAISIVITSAPVPSAAGNLLIQRMSDIAGGKVIILAKLRIMKRVSQFCQELKGSLVPRIPDERAASSHRVAATFLQSARYNSTSTQQKISPMSQRPAEAKRVRRCVPRGTPKSTITSRTSITSALLRAPGGASIPSALALRRRRPRLRSH